jgi:predicted AAA+ superfamily ATPase
MNRWFNTAGSCQPEMHYMLSSMPRLPQLETLIDRAGYFVLHAPRQVGKTTAMLTITQELTDLVPERERFLTHEYPLSH